MFKIDKFYYTYDKSIVIDVTIITSDQFNN
jgi:hypothetical protein